jgi:hypothetical protein
MKKMLLIIAGLVFQYTAFAQVSLGKYKEEPKEPTQTEKNKVEAVKIKLESIQGLNGVTKSDKLTCDSIVKRLNKDISDTVDLYEQKRLYVLNNNTLQNKAAIAEKIVKDRDSLIQEKKDLIYLIRYWEKMDRFDEPKQFGNFFPAYYSTQAIRFFENDSNHHKLFQNNLVNYNPKNKKMILYTEVVNDYLGPFRVGIGFQVKTDAKVDSLSTADSTKKLEKKEDMLGAVQNGGGDISINVKYPIKKSSNPKSGLQYMFYLYANTGFSLPVLNKASDDFLFNYDGGVEGFLYMKGFNNRITFFSQLKAAYYNGNRNYKKVITDADKKDPTGFLLFQTSFGLDFMDGYRLRVDLFSGNSFVKKNFPASITFVVRPGK